MHRLAKMDRSLFLVCERSMELVIWGLFSCFLEAILLQDFPCPITLRYGKLVTGHGGRVKSCRDREHVGGAGRKEDGGGRDSVWL